MLIFDNLVEKFTQRTIPPILLEEMEDDLDRNDSKRISKDLIRMQRKMDQFS